MDESDLRAHHKRLIVKRADQQVQRDVVAGPEVQATVPPLAVVVSAYETAEDAPISRRPHTVFKPRSSNVPEKEN